MTTQPTERATRLARSAAPLAPGALLVALSFRSGGYFADSVALGAVGLLAALLVRIMLLDRPLARLSLPATLGAGGLAALAAWMLLSANWSDAPARAVLEYDRALLYLAAFVVFAALGHTDGKARMMVRGLAAGIVVVCLCALITRLAPDVWAVAPDVADDRLSYPISYWNGLGLLAALGVILCFGLTSDTDEPRSMRIIAAAVLPILGATLLLTFSRGGAAAGFVGLLAVILVARPRALLSGLLVSVPAVGVAVVAAYRADLLATVNPTSAAATAQGHRVAIVVAACVVGAALARGALLALDARLARWRTPAALAGVRARCGLAGAGVAIAVAVALAAGAPGAVERQYDRFVDGDRLEERGGDLRTRLVDPANHGRLFQWEVALKAFDSAPLRGEGAGTYALRWDLDRPDLYQIEDAHSLYVEVLGELGVVGLTLLASVLLLILGGFLRRARGPDRVVFGTLFAAGLAWVLHASVDWDWELPAITLWFFAAGGMALSGVSARTNRRGMSAPTRLLAGVALLIVCIVPVRVGLSQAPLKDSARAFARNDCPTAIDRALDSIEAFGTRPEPYALLGYCDVRVGREDLAIRALQAAVARDPNNWEYAYGLALARGAAGQDPRPAARRAARLNPGSSLAFRAVRAFATDDPRQWRRRARRARLPTE